MLPKDDSSYPNAGTFRQRNLISLFADYEESFWLYLAAEFRRSLVLLGLATYASWLWYKQEHLYRVEPRILWAVYPVCPASDMRPLGLCWDHKFWLLLHQIKSLNCHLGAIKNCWVLSLALFVFSLQSPVSWFLTIWPLHPLALIFFLLCNYLTPSCFLLS